MKTASVAMAEGTPAAGTGARPPIGAKQAAAPKPWSFPARKSLGAFIAGGGILLYLLLSFVFQAPRTAALTPLFFVLLLEGAPLVFGLTRRALRREFGSDLLAGISIVAGVLLGQYLVACIVVLMLSGGTALEEYASRRASSVLDALARRMPRVAHRRTGLADRDVALEELEIGDIVVMYPHEICPVDGVVVEGEGDMNEAYLTGEPFEMTKVRGSAVISGAINGDSLLTIRAEKKAIDSRYARIMRVMEATQQQRLRLRRLGDRLGAWYTPVAVGMALAATAVAGSWERFLAVVVIATPCPLLIAIPVAIIGGISLAARRAIIIKNPAILEQLDACRTFIFDKTGTLTYGHPALDEIRCAPGFEASDVLRAAASLEKYSKHPLSAAILNFAERQRVGSDPASEIHERPGEGLRGVIGQRTVWITGRNRLGSEAAGIAPPGSGLECVVVIDGIVAAVFRFRDGPRKESRGFLDHLHRRHSANRVVLLSGDREEEVRYLAKQMGIGEVHAGKSPEEKVAIVREETGRDKTLFVGDGINDAPAMQAATVGVAFGAGSDITAEAGDAVVLEPSLVKVDELMHIGRRTRSIALESVFFGMGLSILGMIVAAAGYLPPVGGAIAQEIIDLAAVLNAVRAALPPATLTDF
jgi:heavy metal translocating P-type ATPase